MDSFQLSFFSCLEKSTIFRQLPTVNILQNLKPLATYRFFLCLFGKTKSDPMEKIKLLIFFVFLLLFSCQPPDPELGIAEQYLPSAELLQSGVVNKYYYHFESENGYAKNTDIEYLLLKVEKPGQLIWQTYGAGFNLKRDRLYQFEGDKMIMLSEKQIYQRDTIDVEILEPISIDWKNGGNTFMKRANILGRFRRWELNLSSMKDSMVMERPAKILTSDYNTLFVYKEDTTRNEFSMPNIYVEGFGPFTYKYKTDRGTFSSDLVEQMSFAEFQKRANHGVKRVAYIDPENVMDSKKALETCEPIHAIFDYYNGTPDGRYEGGKGALRRTIIPQVDKEKLNNESGYLTFRFVINCKGETGRFVTEQADLDFQKKEFNKETVTHLFEIVESLEKWQPAKVQEKLRDSYAYLTFKLKDGEIIEFLP